MIALIAFHLLSILLLAVIALYLESALHAFRLLRRGLCSADTLANRTGIFDIPALQARVGKPGPDGLYAVPREVWASLPRNRWVLGPRHPLLLLLAGAGLVAGAVHALSSVDPPWLLVLACGGYVFLCVVWQLRWEASKVRTETGEAEPEPEITGATPLPVLLDYLAGLRRDAENELDREATRGDNSPFWRWLFRRLILRKIRKIEHWERRVTTMMGEHEERLRRWRGKLIQVRWRRPQVERAIAEGRAPENARELLEELTRMEAEVESAIREIQALVGGR